MGTFQKPRRGIREAIGEGCLGKVTFMSGLEEHGIEQGQVSDKNLFIQQAFIEQLLCAGRPSRVWAGSKIGLRSRGFSLGESEEEVS